MQEARWMPTWWRACVDNDTRHGARPAGEKPPIPSRLNYKAVRPLQSSDTAPVCWPTDGSGTGGIWVVGSTSGPLSFPAATGPCCWLRSGRRCSTTARGGAGRRVLAVMVETGDWTGVRWRSGSAWSGERATDWLWKVVNRLRSSGVERITVRFEKGSSRRTTSGLCGTSESSTC